ncbi:oxidoreductase [Salipaludibacillus keqinensis]|uniref:Oxidoreductase n=1 Tax=Salipaludibacillus keqinensis TaxID=2045207 RepID=A0A323TCJ4_9BACI|nr:Gfo/Idh/MocA family oxidoreductase [Salipaludibacillus keqinensis]PYZ92396.1 oxidoreductase [Salipaludibacillus keqinensis]
MTLCIGIIGTGSFSRLHAKLLSNMKEVQVQSICGTSREKAEDMASHYEGAKGYNHLVEMLDSEKLDAVYVCVPPMAHGEIELELIGRSIPFFIEKPLGVDQQTADTIFNELDKTNLITSVGYHFRYKDSVQKLKEYLEDTSIGLITGQWMGGMPEVSWWRKQEGSGGQFNEQTTHIVDLLRYVSGEVKEIYACYGNTINHQKYEGVTVPDVGSVIIKLKNGAIANISNTCILPSSVGEIGMTFYTDKGIIKWDPDSFNIIEARSKEEKRDGIEDPYLMESEAFIYAVRTGDTTRIHSTYQDAYETHKITCSALESSLQGIPLKI